MLDRLHRIARLLHRVRYLLWLAVIAALALFAAAVFGFIAGDDVPLASFVVAVWAGFLIAFAQSFATPAPRVAPGAGFVANLRVRIKRALLWFIALGAVALLLFVAFLSLRAVGLILS